MISSNKILLLVLYLSLNHCLVGLNGKIRKSEKHSGYCELDLNSDDNSDTRSDETHGWYFSLFETKAANGEFVEANAIGFRCHLFTDYDEYTSPERQFWHR